MSDKNSKWLAAKDSTNRLLNLVFANQGTNSIEDKVSVIYNNNLHKAMEAVAVWAFKNPLLANEESLKNDLNHVRDSLFVLDEHGFIQ